MLSFRIYSMDQKEVEVYTTLENECSDCGYCNRCDIFYAWGKHWCEDCLYKEATKFGYRIVEK
jgi:hypothetical protein